MALGGPTAIVIGDSIIPAAPVATPSPSKERIVHAHNSAQGVVLRFSDGFEATVDISLTGLNVRLLNLSTIRESTWGGAVELEDRDGHTVHIDSSVLRAIVDPEFATVLTAAVGSLMAPKKAQPGPRGLSVRKEGRNIS